MSLELLLQTFLSAIGTILVILFAGMRKELSDIGSSVRELNTKIAVILKDQEWHKEELAKIEDRLSRVENKLDN